MNQTRPDEHDNTRQRKRRGPLVGRNGDYPTIDTATSGGGTVHNDGIRNEPGDELPHVFGDDLIGG